MEKKSQNNKIEQMLTAAETKARIQAEVEEASAFLNVMDDAEIDGFEDEVLRNGRYVGQPELVWLLEDWASLAPGAGCRVVSSHRHHCHPVVTGHSVSKWSLVLVSQ